MKVFVINVRGVASRVLLRFRVCRFFGVVFDGPWWCSCVFGVFEVSRDMYCCIVFWLLWVCDGVDELFFVLVWGFWCLGGLFVVIDCLLLFGVYRVVSVDSFVVYHFLFPLR